MGDEASFEGYRRALPQWSFADAPSARALRLVARVNRASVSGGALGGGTLIGWPHFRHAFTQLFEDGVSRRGLMLGTGVEEPAFHGRNGYLTTALEREHGRRGAAALRCELEAWTQVLARLPSVAVRGPRSVEVLREVGIEAQAVGDPALLVGDEAATGDVEDRVAGLNVGRSNGLWGDDESAVVEAAVGVARTLLGRGWKVVLVPLSPADPPMLARIASALDGRARVFAAYRQLDDLLDVLRRCHVFVGEKLHSVVLATAVNVPTLALEYHPKCRDFQLSVGRADYIVRTDRLDPDAIMDRLDDLAERRDTHAAEIVRATAVLRQSLRAAAAGADAALTGAC